MSELDFLHEWDDNQTGGDIGESIRRTALLKLNKARGLVDRWKALGGDATATKILGIELGLEISSVRSRLRSARHTLESLK